MQYLLAHDLGTSGDKAVLYTVDGRVVAEVTAAYPTFYPAERAAEQRPEDWWLAFCTATKSLLERSGCRPGDILAVSFSAQMNSCLPVDAKGQALRPAMIWADQRAEEQAHAMGATLGLDRVYQLTGQRLSASYGIAKMAWFKQHEPELYARTARFIQPKDYLICRLTGRLLSDYSDASHLACLDLVTLSWSDEVLQAAGIDANKMPELLPSTAVAGTVLADAARACGLTAGTPVVTGGGDGPCATAGAGIYKPGQAYCSLGTSAWIATLAGQPYLDPRQRTFNLVFLDGRQVMALGAMQAAGLSLSWVLDTFFAEEQDKARVYERMEELTGSIGAGSGGLLFLPYLMGERSPWWNANASGCFIGLRPNHRRETLLRAVMEGVGYNLRLILDALESGRRIEALTMISGGARNKAWLQILADIWHKPLKMPTMLEYATSAGAAICAGIGAGVFKGLDAAAGFNPIRETLSPNPGNTAVYAQALPRFTRAYEALNQALFSAETVG